MSKHPDFLFRIFGFLLGAGLCVAFFYGVDYLEPIIEISIFLFAFLAFCITYYIHRRELLKRYVIIYISLGVFLHARLIWQIIYWYKAIADYAVTRAAFFEISIIEFIIREHPLLLLGSVAAVLYAAFLLVSSAKRSEFEYVTFSDFYIILLVHPLYAFSLRDWSILIIADYAYYCLLWAVIWIISRKKKRLLVYADRNKKQLGEFRQYIYAFYILFAMTRRSCRRAKITLKKCAAKGTLSREDMNTGKVRISGLYKLLAKRTTSIISVAKDVADIKTGKNTCSDQFMETCVKETKKTCIEIEKANRSIEKWSMEVISRDSVDIGELVKYVENIENAMNNAIYR